MAATPTFRWWPAFIMAVVDGCLGLPTLLSKLLVASTIEGRQGTGSGLQHVPKCNNFDLGTTWNGENSWLCWASRFTPSWHSVPLQGGHRITLSDGQWPAISPAFNSRQRFHKLVLCACLTPCYVQHYFPPSPARRSLGSRSDRP